MDTSTQTPRPQHGQKDRITVIGEGPVTPLAPGFRFGRMFPAANQPPMTLKLSSCATIGAHMTRRPEIAREDSDIPAGYTYFGQFVDHDITFDGTEVEADDPDTPPVEATPDADLIQNRSPSLDLDSLYGGHALRDPALFDGPRFRIGRTTGTGLGTGPVGARLPYDLPRDPMTGQAQIGDPRNDENLAVAQTHLMWLKFHNTLVDHFERADPGMSADMLFAQAKDLTIRHYQYVVLHDFLRRFVDADVFEDVIVNGNRKVLNQVPGEVAFMPLEFSVAAYRFGHSQVRENYDWNVNFGPGGAVAGSPFQFLFEFSKVSGNLGGNPTLPTNWIADFRRLYDFNGMVFPHLSGGTGGQLNFAKKIDPFLAPALAALPEIERMPPEMRPPFSNLAALNLRRGSMRGLPSGQDISRALRSVRMLTKAQMRAVIDAAFDTDMERLGFYDRTPLWLYVLLEARALGDGNRMGPLGSILVAETFLTLVLTSRLSILAPGAEWTPAMAAERLGTTEALTTIPHILAWIDRRMPIVDPLQDDRLATG